MTAIDTKRLRLLADESDEIWFEKSKSEHDEDYSQNVAVEPIATFKALLDELNRQKELLAVARAALEQAQFVAGNIAMLLSDEQFDEEEVRQYANEIHGADEAINAALKRMGEG